MSVSREELKLQGSVGLIEILFKLRQAKKKFAMPIDSPHEFCAIVTTMRR